MAAITSLLLLLLGAINVVNSVLVSGEIERTLELIWQSEGGGDGLFPPPDPAPRGPEEGPKNAHDTVLSSNYFLVRYDQEGAVAKVGREPHLRRHGGGGPGAGRPGLRRGAGGGAGLPVPVPAAGSAPGRGRHGGVFGHLRGDVFLHPGAAALGGGGPELLGADAGGCHPPVPAGHPAIAENIERQKQLVTNAGHEIKTPLAIIQSNTEAMELYLGESKWSRNIKEQTRRLGGLMQDLLTLARMDEGAAPAQKAALSLSGLAEQALEPFLQPMEAQGITLERDIQPEVSLTADPAQLEQLLSLLLDNAVKYTGPEGASASL